MKLKLGVIVPKIKFEAVNESQVVAAMGAAIASDITERATRGIGATGALPRPKAGNKPLQSTGRFLGSIRTVQSRRNPNRQVVSATGKRPSEENVAAKKKRARERTKTMRAEKALQFAIDNPARAAAMSKREMRKELKLGRVRRRTADTNNALAGILSTPPKDKRAKNGKRGLYRVLEATDRTRKIAKKTADRFLRYKVTLKK